MPKVGELASRWRSSEAPRKAFTLIELLVSLAIVGALIAILAPAVQSAREAARRVHCAGQIKQIALGCHLHEVSHRRLPWGKTPDDEARDSLPSSTWLFRILPFIEQQAVYDAGLAHWEESPVGTSNPPHVGMATVIPVYGCPADPRASEVQPTHQDRRVALTSYLGVMGRYWRTEDGVLISNHAIRLTEISDGASNTLLCGERPPSADFWFGWWYAGYGQNGSGSADMLLGVQEWNAKHSPTTFHCPAGPYAFRDGHPDEVCDAYHFWSLHPGGANFARADGSVSFVSYGIALGVLRDLSTRSGGETIDRSD